MSNKTKEKRQIREEEEEESSVPIVEDMIHEVEKGHLAAIIEWIICVIGIYGCFMLNSYLKEIM